MDNTMKNCRELKIGPDRPTRWGAELVTDTNYEIGSDFRVGNGLNVGMDFLEFEESFTCVSDFLKLPAHGSKKSGGEISFQYLKYWSPKSVEGQRFGLLLSGSQSFRGQLGVFYETGRENGIWYLALGRRFAILELTESNPFVFNVDLRGEIGHGEKFHFGLDGQIGMGVYF